MKVKAYSVFDSVAQSFLPPFYQLNDGLALRQFRYFCNDRNHDFNRHSSDYQLFCLGEFDDQTGKFDSLASPYPMGLASTFINQEV